MSLPLPNNAYSNVRQLLQQSPGQSETTPNDSSNTPTAMPLPPNMDIYGALLALNPAAMLFSNLAMLQQQMPQLVNSHLDPVHIFNRGRKRTLEVSDRDDCGEGSSGGDSGASRHASPTSSCGDDNLMERKTKRKVAFDAWHQKKLMQLQTEDNPGIADSTTNTTPLEALREQLNQPLPSFNNSIKQRESIGGSSAKELTTPKLSRHNDAAYYPNIQCILCNEWVCSRNRYMHIESHLQYRPYKCSLCGYDNRKEIFIQLHIKRTHKGAGQILYLPDADLEHRAWQLAEQCLQHTRQILVSKNEKESPSVEDPPDTVENGDKKSVVDEKLLVPYGTVYRAKIFNSQRAEKSQLIEESRQLGLVPDFSEVASREEECGVCGSHILRHHAVLEEHVRTHLSQPAYRCGIEGCTLEHHAKNFINRHMKEVHKYRRAPQDLLEENETLLSQFLELCHRCFTTFFNPETLNRVRYRCTTGAMDKVDVKVEGTKPEENTCSILREQLAKPVSLPVHTVQGGDCNDTCCQLCCVDFQGGYSLLYEHIKTHLSQPPFLCTLCAYNTTNIHTLNTHIRINHPDNDKTNAVCNKFSSQVARQCNLLMNACFPDILLQPTKHDPIVHNNFTAGRP